MSHLHLPRLHFRGDFRADVTTANNDDIASAFPTQQFVDSANVRLDTMGMDDATFATWLRTTAPPFGIRAGWNLYGDCSCGFENAQAHAARPDPTSFFTDPAGDSFIGASVALREAVMVDLDPEGTTGTQIFCNEFSLTKGASQRILGRPTRFFSRFVTRRNLGARGFTAFAATWYAAIPPERLTITGNSPILDAFRTIHAAGSGLFVAFNIYLLAPLIPQAQLAADFALGLSTHNPAYGKMVGTLGIWDPTHVQSWPQGRRLQTSATLQHDHSSFTLNPATAMVDPARRVVALDLLNTVPETDATLTKVNVGPLALALFETTSTRTTLHNLGPVPYDRAAYEQQGGVIDVPYPVALEGVIGTGRLALIQTTTNAVVLDEIPTTVETDARALYLQVNTTGQLPLFLQSQLGNAAQTVTLQQYVTSNRTLVPATSANAIADLPPQVDCTPGTPVNVTVKGVRPGTCLVAFVLPGASPSERTFFANIRVLPTDDYSAVPDSSLTFAFIYQEVLRYYHLLYPAMSDVFNLSNETVVRSLAQFILDRINPAQWEFASYMPISRDLSDGKRALLTRWCQKVLGP